MRMSRPTELDPWVRTGVSIGVIPLYLLLTHLLAGVVYRALVPEMSRTESIVTAIVWGVLGALFVGAYAWVVTWRTDAGRPVLHWWVAPVVGVVALVEFAIVVVALVVPHGEAGAEWGASVLAQAGSPRFWAVALWMPLTLWISIAATSRLRHPRPRRRITIAVVPYVVAAAVFAILIAAGIFGHPEGA